ncbi:16632_t:CDS:1, partial [Cetraspora pellucida]
KLIQKAAASELSFSANNPYTEITKESIQTAEEQNEHMLASNYSSDAKEKILLNLKTKPSNNTTNDNKAIY